MYEYDDLSRFDFPLKTRWIIKTETDRDRGDLLSYTIKALSLIKIQSSSIIDDSMIIEVFYIVRKAPLSSITHSVVFVYCLSSNTSTILSGGGNECQLNLLPHTISSSRVRGWVLRMTRGFPFLCIRYNFNNAVIFYECEIYINKRGRERTLAGQSEER
jgi:hypothetical protein